MSSDVEEICRKPLLQIRKTLEKQQIHKHESTRLCMSESVLA
jgi:hypothetical protein